MDRSIYFPILLIWFLIASAVLMVAQFYPLTHYGYNYYGIAYSMWMKNIFWYPVWIDAINVQKTPLFYWLTIFCWKMFGINSWSMPFIILICYLLIAIFTVKTSLTFKLSSKSAQMAGVLVLINLTFINYVNLIRFDIQLTLSVILAIYALSKILYETKSSYWLLYSFSIVLGILFKGPVVLLFVMPAAILGFILFIKNKAEPQPPILRMTKIRYLMLLLTFTVLAILISLLWFVPANLHSHGVYLKSIFLQTMQRFSHDHPDPNLPQLTVNNYHYWHSLGRIMSYLFFIFIVPFVLVLPLLIIRLFYSIKLNKNRCLVYYLFFTILIPIIFFGIFVGLMRARYLLPTIPLACILFAYLVNSVSLDEKGIRVENRIYKGYLIVLLIAGWVSLLLSYLPSTRANNVLFLVLFFLVSMIIFLSAWNSQHWTSRWNRMVYAIVFSTCAFFAIIIYNMHYYPTIRLAQEQLQLLSKKHQILVEINNDKTRIGWTQFLARDLGIKQLNEAEFNQFVHEGIKPSWLICLIPFREVKQFNHEVYPLQFTFQPDRVVPALISYQNYKKYKSLSLLTISSKNT